MEEILVTSPTRVKCPNANGDGFNYIYIDESCVQLETNDGQKKTFLGVSSQEAYIFSNDPDFKGINYQENCVLNLNEFSLVPKSYVDSKIEALRNEILDL